MVGSSNSATRGMPAQQALTMCRSTLAVPQTLFLVPIQSQSCLGRSVTSMPSCGRKTVSREGVFSLASTVSLPTVTRRRIRTRYLAA